MTETSTPENTPTPDNVIVETPSAPYLSELQLRALLSPLNPQRVASRSQGGRSLSYLEAWDVKAALIKLFGFGGFSAEASEAKVLNTESGKGANGTGVRITVMVKVTLTIPQLNYASYAEYAAASQTGQDPGEVLDFAIKTAESDALKRAAIYLGTQFGLSLYDDGRTTDVVRKVLAPGQVFPPIAPPAASGGPAAAMFPEPAPGVTPEQHATNIALANRAFSARRGQGQTQQPETGVEEDTRAAALAETGETPAASAD